MVSSKDAPKISILSPSLNTGRFLRDTIESLNKQTSQNFEYIVVDGGSTDDTLDILKEYPEVRWISEKEEGENAIVDAIWKAFSMSKGEYVIFLCISDGIVDKHWFETCVNILDNDPEISAVWGLGQYMTEQGILGKVIDNHFFEDTPPQKMDFLPFWLSYGLGFESNACFRRSVFEECFSKNDINDLYRLHPSLGLIYRFNTRGYLPFFVPMIAYFGRAHANQRNEACYEMLDRIAKKYMDDIKTYKKYLLSGKINHSFRDGESNIIKKITKSDIKEFKKKYVIHKIKHKLRKYFEKFMEHI